MIKALIATSFAILLAASIAAPYSANGGQVRRGLAGSQSGAIGYGCFDSDRNVGVIDRNPHLQWAQQHSGALTTNLAGKLTMLFNCTSVDGDTLAKAFGEMSVIVANYAPKASCFNNDAGVVSKDAARTSVGQGPEHGTRSGTISNGR